MQITRYFLHTFLACLLVAASVAPGVTQDAGVEDISTGNGRLKEGEKQPPKPYTEEELEIAERIFGMLDGEQQMLLNGLRYLMRPAYEQELMKGLFYVPCPLPTWGVESKQPTSLLESLRLWAMLAAGMPADAAMERELVRFIGSEHERYEDSLAAYAVPIAVCNAALRRPELKHADELREKAEDLMYITMKIHKLTDVESPCIVSSYIWPMWYGNHVWRAVSARCCAEMGVKYNEHIWESELKNVSQATQKQLGWISTQGGGLNAQNDLDCNLLAMAAISMGLSSPEKNGLPKAARKSLEKRLKYVPDILTRLEREYAAEPLIGARLALVRTFDPEFSPRLRKPAEWRELVRQNAVNEMFASGAVYSTTGLTHELGLDGRMRRRRARMPAETALACLSVCGGFYSAPTSPIAGMKAEDIQKAMHALSILHASVLPPMPPGGELQPEVDEAIALGCDWLLKQQQNNGSFVEGAGGDVPIAYSAASLHALMHGGYDHTSAPIKAGMNWLRENLISAIDNRGGNGRPQICSYTAGITLMMYARYYEWLMTKEGVFTTDNAAGAKNARRCVWNQIDKMDRDIITKLVTFLDDSYVGGQSGGWTYGPTLSGRGGGDNSVSQFAGCGYKCAALLGADVKLSTFENEARRLLRQYSSGRDEKNVAFELFPSTAETEDPRFTKGGAYERRDWDGTIKPGGWSYAAASSNSNGYTAMQYVGTGMALLAACRDELWNNKSLPRDLHRDIDLHIFGAQAWLAKQDWWQYDYEASDEYGEENLAGQNPPGGAGWGSIYNLYALERGCVMSGYDLLMGKVDWYYHTARWLLDNQAEAGNWGGQIDTAWAILILRKAAPPGVTQPRPPEEPHNPSPSPDTGRNKRPVSPITPGRVKPEQPEKPDESVPAETAPASPVTPGKGADGN